jgi:hypothetical protein
LSFDTGLASLRPGRKSRIIVFEAISFPVLAAKRLLFVLLYE